MDDLSMNDMDMCPIYPAPPGGSMPDLNLAGFNVASGSARQVMPDPGKPALVDPVLVGSVEDIHMMGIDNAAPRFNHLNLAGEMGTPSPDMVAAPNTDEAVTTNDYTMPDMSQPSIKDYDLGGTGMNFVPEFQPDPDLPDLTEYRQPQGLTIHNFADQSGLLVPDPPISDLIDYDVPGGITICNDPLAPEPNVPDLQNFQVSLPVTMQPEDRPGELDDNALDDITEDPTYSHVEEKDYNSSFMDMRGDNSHRARKFTQLMKGEQAVEKGQTFYQGMKGPAQPSFRKSKGKSGAAGDGGYA